TTSDILLRRNSTITHKIYKKSYKNKTDKKDHTIHINSNDNIDVTYHWRQKKTNNK
ncbi:hypothetical protein PFDG_05349, partial [Plasmodium falciparum Dd2]